MTINIAPAVFCSARTMPLSDKKNIALEVIANNKTITQIAEEQGTSRKFIRKQSHQALAVIDQHFTPESTDGEEVLYHLPITSSWISQCVLTLMLAAHASYRQIKTILKDLIDYELSTTEINRLFKAAVEKSRTLQETEDFSNIEVTANDELFHHNKPILTGIDTRSLYCYLISAEDQRDEETWTINFLDAQDKNLNPVRTIGDDAMGLVSAHKAAFDGVPYDYDNFHLSRGLMDLRRFYRNRFKSTLQERNTLKNRLIKTPNDTQIAEQFNISKEDHARAKGLSLTLDTLISWLEHDVLNKAGPTLKERQALYDFVVDEFKNLESIEPHRITAMRITLENKRDSVLNFSHVMDEKFLALSRDYQVSTSTLWQICQLQRCTIDGDSYHFRSHELQRSLGERFDELEDAVIAVMESTERTSSMVENLNGRIRKHISYRQSIGHGYLDLLRFYLNHKTLVRSAKTFRKGKTPTEILTGKSHPHWLELLDFKRFKRAA